MTFKYSKLQAGAGAIVALVFMAFAGLGFFSRSAWVGGFVALFFGSLALYAIWLCRKMFEVVVLSDDAIVQHRLGSETGLAFANVSTVELRDDKTILRGQDDQRVAVDRNHPAHFAVTQLALNRFAELVVQDAGTTFTVNLYWVIGFVVAGLCFLVNGAWMTQNLGDVSWLGWVSMGLGGLIVALVGALPRRLVIQGDEVEIHGLKGAERVGRSEVRETRLVPIANSGQFAVEIVRHTGRRIHLQQMSPGQVRLWVALEAWKRG